MSLKIFGHLNYVLGGSLDHRAVLNGWDIELRPFGPKPN
jgi:hypothetical protein